MSEHLLIDPNKLYKLYSYKDIKEYYPFDFFASFTSIEIDIFYDILNSLSRKELSNLNNYIFKQWAITQLTLKFKDVEPIEIKDKLLYRDYTNERIQTKDELNTKLNHLIQGDKIISLYIMNQLLKFLYPCNI